MIRKIPDELHSKMMRRKKKLRARKKFTPFFRRLGTLNGGGDPLN
jgi:hypothetical protein